MGNSTLGLEWKRFTGQKEVENQMRAAEAARAAHLQRLEEKEKEREAEESEEKKKSEAAKSRDEKRKAQRMRKGGEGRSSTILTSDLGAENTQSTGKTLLGE